MNYSYPSLKFFLTTNFLLARSNFHRLMKLTDLKPHLPQNLTGSTNKYFKNQKNETGNPFFT